MPKNNLYIITFILIISSTLLKAQAPPPSTGPNGCTNSPLLCYIGVIDEYQGQTLSTPPASPCPFSQAQAPDCAIALCENTNWFSFLADTTYMEIEISPSMCEGGTTGNSLQGVIWEVTDCTTLSGFTPVSNCFSNAAQQDFTLVATNLVVGNIYVIMLDGYEGSLCQYYVNVLVSGSGTPEPMLNYPISGPTQVSPGEVDLIYCVDLGIGVQYYEWSFLGLTIGSITDLGINADETQYCVSVDITEEGVGYMQVLGSNDCNEAPPLVTPIVSIFAELTALCQDINVPLDAFGVAVITAEDIDNGSAAASGNTNLTYTIDQSTFNCDDIGANEVTLTITAANGDQTSCASTVTVLGPITDLTISVDGGTISTTNNTASYQWLDCDNDFPIAGAINQSYTPPSSGNFALELTEGGCVDTTACVYIVPTSTSDLPTNILSIYPNPTQGNVTINLDNSSKGILKAYDLKGRLIHSQPVQGESSLDYTTDGEAGLYLIEFVDERGEVYVGKVVKM